MLKKHTPLLPNFPHRFGRPRMSRLSRLQREMADLSSRPLADLRSLFSDWIDRSALAPPSSKTNSRKRTFSLEVVFWAFLFQVLSGVGCRGAVSKVQSWLIQCGQAVPSSNCSAYCQARNRLPKKVLNTILDGISRRVSRGVGEVHLWFGHHVKVVDGTGVSASDTEANQAEWPQSRNMKTGCGFPLLKLTGLFCLHTGAVLGWEEGNKLQSEIGLWRKLWRLLSSGDVVLGDRAFGSYADIARLLARGVHGVYRLNASRKVDWRRGVRLGHRDRLQVWTKPKRRPNGCTKEQWKQLPAQLKIRLIEKQIDIPGFRSEKLVIVTTLLDPSRYAAEELVNLYRRRWAVELFFRDVKTTLGMDELGSRTPAMVRKELTMYMICYNLLRALIQQASRQEGVEVERISFKGTAQKLYEWLPVLMESGLSHPERRSRLEQFCRALTTAPVPDRPDRYEPRVRKRRPKNFRLMTRPRNADKPGRVA